MKYSNGKCARCGKNKALPGARRCRRCQDLVNERQRELRAARKQAGLCKCGRKPPRPGKSDCEICAAEMAKSSNVTYQKRREKGLCACGNRRTRGFKSCEACRARNRKAWAKMRRNVFEHYGLSCACCGESTFEFLEIDHVDGDGKGNDHRREIGYSGIYKWLIRNGFPEGFQTLCSNCNRAKFRYGVCPHQTQNR